MKLRTIIEDTSRYYIELALVGPKNQKSSRKLGEYLLPHSLSTINWELIENLAYLERCVIYDLTHDQIAIPEIQLLKNEFIKQKSDAAEIIINYKIDYYDETQKSYWKGSVVPNGPEFNVSSQSSDYYSASLLINGKMLKIPNEYGYAIFLKLEKTISSY